MKKKHSLKSGVLSLAVLASAVFLPSASASVIGHLVVGICGGGGVIVDASLIDWEPGSPAACLQLGLGTAVSSVGSGSLTPASPNGTINDLPAGSIPPTFGFMSFTTGSSLLFDLAAVGPGSLVLCSAGNPGVNNSCSVSATSPFVLTQTTGGTSVSLSANGTIADTVGPVSVWSGAFTTQINTLLPFDIYTTITGGGSITSSFSGEFDISAAVPEPVSLGLIGGGLIALAAIKRRRLV